jgi:hypothetical protein
MNCKCTGSMDTDYGVDTVEFLAPLHLNSISRSISNLTLYLKVRQISHISVERYDGRLLLSVYRQCWAFYCALKNSWPPPELWTALRLVKSRSPGTIAGLWLDNTAAYTFLQGSTIVWCTVDHNDGRISTFINLLSKWNSPPSRSMDNTVVFEHLIRHTDFFIIMPFQTCLTCFCLLFSC